MSPESGEIKEKLYRLAAELDTQKPGFDVEQAAVWISTDNVSYSQLGICRIFPPEQLSTDL